MSGSESAASSAMREAARAHAAYRGTGARVTYVSGDFHCVRIEVPLDEGTRNLQGSIFGGSMYGAVDPWPEVLLIQLLGPGYEVWTKEATIRFRRPARSMLVTEIRIDDDELEAIRRAVHREGRTERSYAVALRDAEGVTCAEVTKTVHVAPSHVQGQTLELHRQA